MVHEITATVRMGAEPSGEYVLTADAEARIRELKAALREADCPRPINGAGVMLEDHTVGLCVKLGYCGCGNAALLAADREGEPT